MFLYRDTFGVARCSGFCLCRCPVLCNRRRRHRRRRVLATQFWTVSRDDAVLEGRGRFESLALVFLNKPFVVQCVVLDLKNFLGLRGCLYINVLNYFLSLLFILRVIVLFWFLCMKIYNVLLIAGIISYELVCCCRCMRVFTFSFVS